MFFAGIPSFWGVEGAQTKAKLLTLQIKPFSELSYSCLLFPLPSLDAEIVAMGSYFFIPKLQQLKEQDSYFT